MRIVTSKTAMTTARDLSAKHRTSLNDFAATGRIENESHRAALLDEARGAIGSTGSLPATLNHRAYALVRYLTRTPLC
jgi:hypothetical protein